MPSPIGQGKVVAKPFDLVQMKYQAKDTTVVRARATYIPKLCIPFSKLCVIGKEALEKIRKVLREYLN